MEFHVPQFIDIEDKIIGPLTMKQFLVIGIGSGLLFIIWLSLKLGAFIVASLFVIPATLFIAFKKINGRPCITFVWLWAKFLVKPKIFIWKQK